MLALSEQPKLLHLRFLNAGWGRLRVDIDLRVPGFPKCFLSIQPGHLITPDQHNGSRMGGALTGTAFNFVGKKQMPLRVAECQESEGGVAQEGSSYSLGYAEP